MCARCGTRENFTDDRRAMQADEFSPRRIITCGLLYPERKFNDHNQAIVGRTNRRRHALSTPAMACKNCLAKRHVAKKVNASASPIARYIDSYARIPAPRPGPFRAPPDGENCDVGDNPFIC